MLLLCGHVRSAHASDSVIAYADNPAYRQLNTDFRSFSYHFYRTLIHHQYEKKYYDINRLALDADRAYVAHEPVKALGLIYANLAYIKNNINNNGIIEIESLLLQVEAFDTAAQLLTIVNNQADPSIVSNVQYAFAKYYYAHDEWQKTIKLISQIANNLPQHDYEHALLMQGIALQSLRHHRHALTVYAKIPKTSPFYVTARIDMAVANIRQQWWTEGYDILTVLLKRPDIQHNPVLADRLNTIIGYLFLQLEYYRNSRNAFRKVGVSSPYTKQALLGIALDAGYQHDYVGALNAARILQHKHSHALQVDEANLLLPYFYEKLGQSATASAGYTDAMKYYDDRLDYLKGVEQTPMSTYRRHLLDGQLRPMVIANEKIPLGRDLPASFFTQAHLLKIYGKKVTRLGNNTLSQQYQHLLGEYVRLIQQLTKTHLKQKANDINDYLSQCRYGVARLYDRNASQTN